MSSSRVPDLWDHIIPNQSPVLIAISILFHLLSTIFFAARMIWRFKHRQKGWDDFMATAAWITLFVQTTFGAMAAHYGFGKHRVDIASTFSKALFYFFLYQICYMILGVFTKLTFCFLYLRLFRTHQQFKKLVWWTTGVIVVGGTAFLLATVWQCTPVKKAWDISVFGTCTDKMAFWYSHAAFNTIMDMVVFILPIPLIGTLQMARKSKLGLIPLFSLGAFVVAASIVRMVYLKQFAQSDGDYIWDSMPALIWTEIESNTAMICCCLPALGSLGTKAWRRMRGKPLTTPATSAAQGANPADLYPGYSSDRRSFGRGLEYPNQEPGLGNFTDIHYTPPRSPEIGPEDSTKKRGSDVKGASRWLKDMLSTISGINSSSSKTSVPSADLQIPEGYLAPKLEMGTLYKATKKTSSMPVDVAAPAWKQSAYMNDGLEQRTSGGIELNKLAARDPRAKHANMGGLEEFLRQGDANSSRRSEAGSHVTEWPRGYGSNVQVDEFPYLPDTQSMDESGDPYAIGKGRPRGKEAGW